MTWVNGKHGIKRWVGERPQVEADPPAARVRKPRSGSRTGKCADCPTKIELQATRCWGCYTTHTASKRVMAEMSDAAIDKAMQTIARNLAVTRTWDWTLCHCGCLVRPGETCPACLVWAIRDAEKWAWAQERKANRGHIWDVLKGREVAA